MAGIGQGGGARRPPISQKAFVMRLTKHGLVASAWPRPRGRIRDPYQRANLDRLTEVTHTVKRMNDREVDPLRQALNEHNRKNQGQMGTATIRLRDLLTANMYGRLFEFELPGRGVSRHIDAVQDVSRRFDWLEPGVGSILTRTERGWLPTFACEAGARCYLMPSQPVSGCCQPANVQPSEV